MMDATGEMSSSKYATGGDRMQSSMLSGAGGLSQADGMQEATHLTEEELEALKPQEIRVVNPWIHEHTHKEYLEHVTVSHPRLLKHNFPPTIISGRLLADRLLPSRHFDFTESIAIAVCFLISCDRAEFIFGRVFSFFN
jgi:hypothetical protein